MSKNVVVCCDGTGNEVNTELSNVLKLYRVMKKDDSQCVYYNPGIGTFGQHSKWHKFFQYIRGIFELATGFGLDEDILSAYRFLCEKHEPGDKIWLFGFSRGAYTVRVLAALLNMVGLLEKNQLNLSEYALSIYKRVSLAQGTSDEDKQPVSALSDAWRFAKVTGTRYVQIEFIGVWDTVSSVLVPVMSCQLLDFEQLPYTQKNIIVKNFRHAIAIDERRRMFRLHQWTEPQYFRVKPFRKATDIEQNIKQVWFAGVHADIGGGYPEAESGLSKSPLEWMIKEARSCGLLIDTRRFNQLVCGKPRKGSKYNFVSPDARAEMHNSLTFGWALLEWLPNKLKMKEWRNRRSFFGWYLPLGEPRVIPENALIHHSVRIRMETVGYQPENLPLHYEFTES